MNCDYSLQHGLGRIKSLGGYFARMMHKQMFRKWLLKRDNVSDVELDDHVLETYVRRQGSINLVVGLLKDFKDAHS